MEEKRSPYYTPFEVSLHNSIDDIWVSYLGNVYDLTKLCEQYKGDVLLKPIHEAAGQDISHWFDETTGDVRVEMSQLTNTQRYHTPHGRFVHVPPPMPHTDWLTNFGRPWWKDNKYEVGHLTTKTRQIRVINTLTSQEEVIEVCSEETMSEILQRYLKYNAHAASYTWKYNGVNLNMEHTLDENGIKDEDEIFYKLQVDSELYRQAILLYFNDDLTEL